MTHPQVVVLDYGSGNVHSAVKALEAAGAEVTLTASREQVAAADGLLLPGVGSFAHVMDRLAAIDAARMIGSRLAGGRPVLGICVGMQVLFEHGLEGTAADTDEVPGEDAAPGQDAAPAASTPPHAAPAEPRERIHARAADEFWWAEDAPLTAVGTPGLGEWPGTVRRLRAPRLPHMGWNTVTPAAGSRLFTGIEHERFYFVHSYAAPDLRIDTTLPGASLPQCTYAEYGERFLAAAEHGPLAATQFHPEKSGAAGVQLLRNWVDALPRG